MNIETILKIKNNPNDLKYLKDNSHWYKYLNRNGSYLKNMEEEMKEKYKIRTEDKIKNVSNALEDFSKIIDILK